MEMTETGTATATATAASKSIIKEKDIYKITQENNAMGIKIEATIDETYIHTKYTSTQ